MAGTLPRVKCPVCGEKVAAHDTRHAGIVSIVDHKRRRRDLVLCSGSMQHVTLASAAIVQEPLPGMTFEQAALFGGAPA
ncbi:hypothetical protein AB0A05_27345 [Streptomyces sp. NPDC046374]|uniref:hypothetical protein n=1 Tax=Streptomyces sp. NPDC046374 TaxID=3154917 RepID=UPI0033EBBA89